MTLRIDPEQIATLDNSTAANTESTKAMSELAQPVEGEHRDTGLKEKGRRAGVKTPKDRQDGVSFKTDLVPASLMTSLSAEPNWQKMDVSQKQKFVETMESTLAGSSPELRQKLERDFVRLVSRNVLDRDGNSIPTLLQMDEDRKSHPDSRTTLEHLHHLATSQTRSSIQAVKPEFFSELVRELAAPRESLNQGAGTKCGPMAVQAQLIRLRPAEYARIFDELAVNGEARIFSERTSGSSKHLELSETARGEQVLRLSQIVPGTGELSGRSYSEYYFQKAFGEAFGEVEGGMYNTELERGIEAMGFAVQRYGSSLSEDKLCSNPLEFRRFFEQTQKATTPASQDISIVALSWGERGARHELHFVEITAASPEGVTIRTAGQKEGDFAMPAGYPLTKLPGNEGLYRMNLEDFKKLAVYGFVSDVTSQQGLASAIGVTAGHDRWIMANAEQQPSPTISGPALTAVTSSIPLVVVSEGQRFNYLEKQPVASIPSAQSTYIGQEKNNINDFVVSAGKVSTDNGGHLEDVLKNIRSRAAKSGS